MMYIRKLCEAPVGGKGKLVRVLTLISADHTMRVVVGTIDGSPLCQTGVNALSAK